MRGCYWDLPLLEAFAGAGWMNSAGELFHLSFWVMPWNHSSSWWPRLIMGRAQKLVLHRMEDPRSMRRGCRPSKLALQHMFELSSDFKRLQAQVRVVVHVLSLQIQSSNSSSAPRDVA